MKKSHAQLARLAHEVYKEFEYEVEGIEFSLIDNVWVCRGTDEVSDWVTNARVLPWHVERVGWCHSGFIKTAQKVFSKMLAVSLQEDADERYFQFTGHSLGGAIALGCAAYFTLYGIKPLSVCTFGAPAIGKLKILNDTDVVCYRYGKDVVPQVPLLMSHPRNRISVGEPSKKYWNVSDHDMSNYLAALRPN